MNTETIIELLLKTEDQILDSPLVELQLSKRVHSSLLRHGVETIGDLAQGWAGIRSTRTMEEKAYWELSKALYLWHRRTTEPYLSIGSPTKTEREDSQPAALDHHDHSLAPIEALELSPRTYYLLKQSKINTIGELYWQWDQLASLKRVGPSTLVQIQKALDAFKDSIPADRLHKKNLPDGRAELSERPSNGKVPSKDLLPAQSTTAYFEEIKKIHIEALDLPTRAYNTLKHNHIDTVGQIMAKWDRLGSLAGIGPTSTEQIHRAIQGLETAMGSAVERSDTPDSLSSEGVIPIRKSIYHLQLFDRTYPLLIKNGIYTIDQITPAKLEELKSRGVLCTALIWDIQRGIHAWLNGDETLKNTYFESMREEAIRALPEGSNFEEHFDHLLREFLTPVQLAVIENRYGLKTGKGLTLAKTAAACKLTSARVWQIESAVLRTLQYPFALHELRRSLLILKMRQVIEDHGGLVSEQRLLHTLQEQLRFQTYSVEGVLRLIRQLFDENIRLLSSERELRYIDGLEAWSHSSWDVEQILQTARGIFEILATSKSPQHWSDIYPLLIQEDGLMDLEETFARAIALCLRDNEVINDELDGRWSKTRK